MGKKFDLSIIGAGALGSWHAYWALERGLSVRLFEKENYPVEATVRNFGQIVPSGMSTEWWEYGKKSIETYQKIQAEFDISIRNNGSTYIASSAEEFGICEEISQYYNELDYPNAILTKEKIKEWLPNVKDGYNHGGLYFPTEITAEPRTMIHRLHEYLRLKYPETFEYHPNTPILHTFESNGNCVTISSKNVNYYSSKILVCTGRDFKILYPELFNNSGLIVCRLGMMITEPQANIRMNGAILSGLTIRRYPAFKSAPSFNLLPEIPEKKTLVDNGVHILFKQAIDGSVIIGDSHHYSPASEMETLGFDIDMRIQNIMIAEAKEIIDLENWNISHHWNGYYAQHPNKEIYLESPSENIHIITGIGGKGMTTGCGFAFKNISNIL